VNIQQGQFLHETNWLGVNLVFYNVRTKKWSTNLNEVIDLGDFRFSKEGLHYYLQNGFVMYGLTPLEDVFYTLPNTTLILDRSGNLQLIHNTDPVVSLIAKGPSSTSELESLLEDWFSAFHEEIVKSGSNVILPLSGGLDSRMLASYLKGKKYVQAFTYGISMDQKQSYEVVLAKEAAKKMQLKWSQVELSSFHRFLQHNYETYGISTHAHSMYHFEFYSKIVKSESTNSKKTVLSGIYGDVWAGSWEFPQQIKRAADLSTLVIHHGLNLSGFESKIIKTREREYFEDHKYHLTEEKYRILTAARIKAPLIRHLIETPRYFGLDVVSPFFEPEIVACMLNLPVEQRKNREWQRKFIDRKYGKPKKRLNNLGNSSDLTQTRKSKLPSLELQLLPKDFPNRALLQSEKTQGLAVGIGDLVAARMGENRLLCRIFPSIRKIKSHFHARYFDYMTLYPIIELLKRSDQHVEK
jgi:asparagine synthetase B (glutamine-hydrolysing)